MNIREYLAGQQQQIVRHYENAVENVERCKKINNDSLVNDDIQITCVSYLSRDPEEVLVQLANKIIESMFTYAERHFGTSGTLAPISIEPYRETYFPWLKGTFCEYPRYNIQPNPRKRKYGPDDIKLVELWESLERDHGNGKGEERALTIAANAIVNELGRALNGDMNQTKRSVVLSQSIRLDDWFNGKYRIYHNYGESVATLLRGLETFAEWAQSGALKSVLFSLRHLPRDEVDLRSKFGMLGTLEVRVFKQKLEYHLSHDLALQLNEFLATYSTKRAA